MDSTTGNMTCALKLETETPGWHKTLTKVLKRIEGLSYSIDAERGIARVSGKIDPGKLLLMLQKSAKHAELLWIDSGNHSGYYNYNRYMNPYGSMEPYYTRDPYQSGYFHSDYVYPPYDPNYSYFEPLARHFPQAPPPPQNPRLDSFCNMM